MLRVVERLVDELLPGYCVLSNNKTTMQTTLRREKCHKGIPIQNYFFPGLVQSSLFQIIIGFFFGRVWIFGAHELIFAPLF